jgi:hypothetical protein
VGKVEELDGKTGKKMKEISKIANLWGLSEFAIINFTKFAIIEWKFVSRKFVNGFFELSY